MTCVLGACVLLVALPLALIVYSVVAKGAGIASYFLNKGFSCMIEERYSAGLPRYACCNCRGFDKKIISRLLDGPLARLYAQAVDNDEVLGWLNIGPDRVRTDMKDVRCDGLNADLLPDAEQRIGKLES